MDNELTRVVFVSSGLGSGGAERTLLHLLHQQWPPQLQPGLISIENINQYGIDLPPNAEVHFGEPGVVNVEALLRTMETLFDLVRDRCLGLLAPDLAYLPQFVTALQSFGDTPIVVVTGLFDVMPAVLLARHMMKSKYPIVAIEQVNPHFFFQYEQDYSLLNAARTKALVQRCYKFADRVVPVSRAIARILVEEYCVPSSKITPIPNPVSVPTWHATDKTFGVVPRLIAMGRLHPVKRYDFLLRAMAILLTKMPSAQLTIIGDGDARSALELLAGSLGVASSVTFAGFQKEPWKWFRDSTVFVHTSYTEALPLSMLEAMAAGLPIVSTPWPGVEEIVIEGVNGHVTCDDPGHFATVIAALVTDQSRLQRFSNESAERALAFDLTAVVWPQYRTVFESLPANVVDRRGCEGVFSISDWLRTAREPVTIVAAPDRIDSLRSWLGTLVAPKFTIATESFVMPSEGDVLISTPLWPDFLESLVRRECITDLSRLSVLS